MFPLTVTGVICELQLLHFADPCLSDPCQNGGLCTQSDSTSTDYTCQCTQSYDGDNCENTSTRFRGVYSRL